MSSKLDEINKKVFDNYQKKIVLTYFYISARMRLSVSWVIPK